MLLVALICSAIEAPAVLRAGTLSEGWTASILAYSAVSGGFAAFFDLAKMAEYGV